MLSGNSSNRPKLSIISPSLNTGKYLQETIDSLLKQTFQDFEYIVIDGGSTDETLDILKEHPEIRWVSEREEGDNGILDALWKGMNMARGNYFGLLAISDLYADKDWFAECVRILDQDIEVSAVWGMHQAISEEGHAGAVPWSDYFQIQPPQKMDFLPFWLAKRHDLESNAIFRTDIFKSSYPKNLEDEPYRYFSHCGLNYRFNTKGYLPYFLPRIVFYAKTHKAQRQERLYERLDSVNKLYDRDMTLYRKKLLSGKIKHVFRDGNSRIIKEIGPQDLWRYRKSFWKFRLIRRVERTAEKLIEHIHDYLDES